MSNGQTLWYRNLKLDEGMTFEALSPSEQVDVICDAYEQQWQSGDEPLIEHFLAESPPHIKKRAFQELLPLECEYRIQRGEIISFRDLADRFPDDLLAIARMICRDDQIVAHSSPAIERLGDFHLLEEVGRGAFGTAYRAYDEGLDRFVAVKLPHASILNDEASVRRFVREGSNAGRLSHPGIVTVHDVRKSERGPFILSDYVEGETLSEYLKSHRRVAPRTAASLVAQLAEALDYAHNLGIVHRDLKPGNVMLEPRKPGDSTQDGTPHDSLRPRILDFGLAHREDSEASLTMEGTMIGTPAYMSPEQARGEVSKTDARVDIYSLGVILYELMVGRRLFEGESFSAVLTQVLHEDATAARRFDRSIPKDLATICSKCVDPLPERRYQTAAELAIDLRRWLNDEPIRARPISRTERSVRWVSRHRAIAASLCAVVVIGFVALFIAVRGKQHSSEQRIESLARGVMEARSANLESRVRELQQSLPADISYLDSYWDNPQVSPRNLLRLHVAALPSRRIDTRMLVEAVPTCDAEELGFIGTELAKHGFAETESLWQELTSRMHSGDTAWVRFAACLASVDSKSMRWEQIANRVSDYLISLSPEDASASAVAFSPVAQPQLCSRLADSLRSADGRTHRTVTSALESLGFDHALLVDALQRDYEPSSSLPEELVQQQANTVLALLALGREQHVWQHFAGRSDDPRLQTYLIRRAAERVSPKPLIRQLLEGTNSDVRYTALLALGRFEADVLRDSGGRGLIDALVSTYKTDADSGVHSATGWLLRRLGVPRDMINQNLYKEGIRSDRDWFHNKLGQCMIIIRKPEWRTFQMGSPKDATAKPGEELHAHVIRRVFAIAAAETTWTDFVRLMPEFKDRLRVSNGDHPVDGLTFPDLVRFCRRLNEWEKLDATDVFEETKEEGWYVDVNLSGYRMPTDGEWECVCRAGTTSVRFFGGLHTSCADAFAPAKRPDGPYAVATYMPNRWGLFGLYGNVSELVLGKFYFGETERYREEITTLPLTSSSLLILRGGSYHHPIERRRSALRGPVRLDEDFGTIGLRLGMTLTEDR